MPHSCCQLESSREGLYTDIALNKTLCERFTGHIASYGKKIIQKYDKVLTGSSDVGEFGTHFRGSLYWGWITDTP